VTVGNAVLAVIVIAVTAFYLWRWQGLSLYLLRTKLCPQCNGHGRINQSDNWAGTTRGDECPTCNEEGRVPL
jgi:hypothetical protein